jgi:proteasome lid subunit RPN8/RPN11
MLNLSNSCRESIRAHGEGAFPEECCGAMLGRDREDGTREIVDLIAAPNTVTAQRRRRYLLDPKVLLAAERTARRRGLDLLGIYHSHPDHPSTPSELDRQHAWPCWSYVILSVRDGCDAGLQSWRLRDDRSRFDEEEIEPAA